MSDERGHLVQFLPAVVQFGVQLARSWPHVDDDELMLNVLRCHETY